MPNSIVAVSIVVIALSLLAIDLREDIMKKTFCISIFMLIVGGCASISNINPILGFIIDLGVIFFIVYEGTNLYKESLYFPFLLSYIFMKMSAPASLSNLPMRMVAIFVGCSYILIVQLILNKDRFKKTITGTKKGIISITVSRIDYLLGGSFEKFPKEEIYPLTQTIVKAIYDNRKRGRVMSSKNKGRIALVLAVENLFGVLSNMSEKSFLEKNEIELLKELKSLLKQVDKHFCDFKAKEAKRLEISEAIEKLSLKVEGTNLTHMVEILMEIPKALELIEDKAKEAGSSTYIKDFIKPIKKETFSFKFALKVSVSVSSIILLSKVFDLIYGRWIIFPLIAIIQPKIEGTFKKSLERVSGTLIGIVIFVFIFSLIKDNTVRLNITIFLAYINLFVKKYYISTSLIAVSALGSVAMGGAGIEILFLRVIFTIIGCIVGLIINKYFYYNNVESYNAEAKKEYKKHIYQLQNTTLCETKRYDAMLKSKLLQYKLVQS